VQNGRSDNAAVDVPSTAQMGNSLLWKHARGLIFEAGNEYRRFEMLSVRTPGMRIQQMQWFPPYYHATIADTYTEALGISSPSRVKCVST